ncbi:type VI secretion system tip protein TssI/VgrG [Pantoea dispersa]|uniref:type VI secretion system tip protein TssI/VgrG n=1 Tax=Pantoea dispersa TaxID=59814 RepID=UPI0021C60C92|nr:type VI secretion system tip protein TssI/VgrG [Pantoea dispersa]UXO69060.1 type VI secretion system tip protein VgrG [Pantoea dispersa]
MFSRITAQLPMDGLLFWKLTGAEALSQSFELNAELLATDARIDRHALLGQPVTFTLPTQSLLSPRYLNGKITRVAVRSEELSGTRYAVYQLRVEPDLWPMRRDRNLRIFQGQTVPQIVQALLQENGVNVETRLGSSYRVWEYCVQYQESSFDFISRLMELEGIYYWFRHEAERHVMVLCDGADQHEAFAGYETIPYHVTASGGSVTEEGISQWSLCESVTPGMYSTDDYDFRKPNAWMLQARQNPVSPVPGAVDVYDWPGHFVDHSHGEFYTRIRQEVWQVAHHSVSGTGTATGIAPGYRFGIVNAPHFSDNGEYLVTSARYDFEENGYASGGSGARHNIAFTVLPSSVTYRAEPATAWPKTHGPQTAKVVGPAGESIWTDRYGRVKVKFHWDRLAKGDDTSSCWVRVSSAWAGQGFGGVQIPRVNDEVVVDFINGDPDRPLIIGRVYNEASMPPWALPAAATQMGFLSRSKDGTADTANALRFEDKAGEEHLWIQAQKNMDTHVKNDASHSVANNHSHYAGGNELYRVETNRVHGIKGGEELLTGQGKLDAAVDTYVLGSGTKLRLECGESAIELNANGHINIVGKGFNIFVQGDGHITTSGGKLNLNTDGAKPGTGAPGADHKQNISKAVENLFPPKQKGQAAPAAPKAAKSEPKNAADQKYDDNFSKLSPIILRHEGGYANRAADKGGPTNHGIAWKTWQRYAQEDVGVEPTLDNLKKLTPEQAEVIYKKRYWDAKGFNDIKDPKLALMSYDWTITSGGAGKQIQKLLNSQYGKNLKVDGAIGPDTIAAMNSVADSNELTENIAEIRKVYYKNLTISDPNNLPNLNGWINRVNDCLNFKG